MEKVPKGLMKAGAVGASATLLGGAGSALLLALAASPAGAVSTWTVDTLADGAANASDCSTPVVDSCSLRDALAAAAVGDAISFSPALFSGGAGTITLTDGQLVNIGVDVLGPGANLLTIDAAAASRVFYLTPAPAGATISGVTLTNGLVTDSNGGGAILAMGTLTVRESVLTGNVGGLGGGAIYAQSLFLIDSVVSDNSVEYFGGGVLGADQITISGSTISGNRSGFGGGGIGMVGVEENFVSIFDSTVSGNSATYGGGFGSFSEQLTVLIANSTFTANTAVGGSAIVGYASRLEILMSTITGNASSNAEEGFSGAVLMFAPDGTPPTLDLTGSVLAGNSVGPGGIADLNLVTDGAPVTVQSSNSLIGSGVSPNITLVGNGVLRSDAPMLGALANNGGPTLTMLPLVGSPLIDAGPVTIPTFPGNEFDQRGPGFPRVLGSKADIGAVEAPHSEVVTPVFTG
jgi:predicted outer membrane repeat protein